MDLAKSIHAAVDKIVASGKIEEAIEALIEKCLVTVLSDQLRSYSDFGKHVEEAVKQSLDFDPEKLDLPSYNEQILKIVRSKIQHMTRASIEKQVAEQLEQLLEPAPETITLSKLVESFIEYVKERRRYDCVCHDSDEISFHFSDDHEFRYLRLDESPGKDAYQCKISMGIYKGKIFSLKLGGVDCDGDLFSGPFYRFERLLFQCKAAKTEIVFDCEPEEIDVAYMLETGA